MSAFIKTKEDGNTLARALIGITNQKIGKIHC